MTLRELDDTSRAAVKRFMIEVAFASFLTIGSKENPLLIASSWLTLYALFAGLTAVLLGDRLMKNSFNRWDEMAWLITIAQGLKLVHQSV